MAIEQDVAWFVDPATGHGRPVVSHDAKPDGTEPTLEAHFFDRVRPLMERALTENRRDTWPVMVLHLDFKTNEPAHHQAIWELLGRHEAWLTTAARSADDRTVTPFVPGPLLVITEAGEHQVDTFYTSVPAGGRLRISARFPRKSSSGEDPRGAREGGIGAARDLDPERRDQLPAMDQLRLGGGRAGGQNNAGPGPRRRAAAAGDRVAGPLARTLGTLLHAQRPSGG